MESEALPAKSDCDPKGQKKILLNETPAAQGGSKSRGLHRLPLHKVGIGAVYQSNDKRATVVQVTRWTDKTYSRPIPYFKWSAKLDGKHLGEGSLNHCRKLIRDAL